MSHFFYLLLHLEVKEIQTEQICFSNNFSLLSELLQTGTMQIKLKLKNLNFIQNKNNKNKWCASKKTHLSFDDRKTSECFEHPFCHSNGRN